MHRVPCPFGATYLAAAVSPESPVTKRFLNLSDSG
jgi:hypothetical protein